MNLFGLEIKRKSFTQPPVVAEFAGGKYFYYLNFEGFSGSRSRQIIETDTPQGQLLAYQYCSPLSTIVSKKVAAFNNARLSIVDSNGKPATRQSVSNAMSLLKRPNPIQTWREFQTLALTYVQIFGECFIYMNKAFGNQPKTLYVLPNQYLQCLTTGKMYQQFKMEEIISGYQLTLPNSSPIDFTIDEVYRVRDNMINPIDPVRGYSRLSPLLDNIITSIATTETAVTLTTRMGALGMWSPQASETVSSMPMLDPERIQLQNDWQRYGGSKDKYPVIIAKQAMKWSQMSPPTKDLMLSELNKDAVREMSNTYGYPFGLLNFQDTNNMTGGGMYDELNKQLYQDTIIPEYTSWLECISEILGIDKTAYILVADFYYLPIFAEDEQARATALKTMNEANEIALRNGIITVQQWQQMAYQDEKGT